LRVIKSLWTVDKTEFTGRYYRLTGAVASPKPVQKPYPPIWIGASGPSTLKLVALHADVWNISGNIPLSRVKELIELFEQSCAANGRDPATVRRSIQIHWNGADLRALQEQSALYREHGFLEQIVMFSLDQAFTATQLIDASEKLAAFLPDHRLIMPAEASRRTSSAPRRSTLPS